MATVHAAERRTQPFRRLRRLAAAAVVACAVATWTASAGAVPSAVVHYGPDLPASLDQYAAPGNVIVVTAEQRNRNPGRIRAWRAKGAIVLAYVDLIDYHRPYDPIQDNLFGGAFPSAWFHPCGCSEWGGQPMLDLRASSRVATYNGFTGTWGQYAARWIRNEVIKDGSLFDGVFLDVWGARIWNAPQAQTGPGSDWEAGIAKWGQEIRNQVGPNIFLVANNHQTQATAAPLNGRMWESFDGTSGGYNNLTGQGEAPGLVYTFNWPQWVRPQLDILWRNEANPSQSTKAMLVSSAQRVTKTGSDIAVGASDHQGGFPAPFGGGGGVFPPPSTVPGAPGTGAATVAAAPAPLPGGASRALTSLVRSSFAGRGIVTPWTEIRHGRSRIAAKRDGVAFITGHGAGPYAAMVAPTAPQQRAAVAVRLRITKMILPVGQARALLAVGGDGQERQVGVLRTSHGLVWAAWTLSPKSGRLFLAKSRVKAKVGDWVTLRLATDWAGPHKRDSVKVGTTVVLRVPVGRLAGHKVQGVMVGLGRTSTRRELAAVVVKHASVAGAPA